MSTLVHFADPESDRLDGLVDLERYPIEQPGSPEWRAVVLAARESIAADGCLSLPGFLAADALETAHDEVAVLAGKAVHKEAWSSVYTRTDLEADLALDDPRRMEVRRSLGHVTRDQIAPDTVVARLYANPVFKAFVAGCLGLERVFEYADPLAGLIVTVVPDGGELSWHYDTNEFVVSLMTQQPDDGGLFEFCPDLRKPSDENIEGLGRVLRGEADELIHTRALRPGDLQIFRGRYSLHRVTPVSGERERHVVCLGYADRPGVIGPVDRTRAVYGRVTEAHLLAEGRTTTAAPDGLVL
ncbi:MAG: hypothetical protein CL424_19780 [Acidimicrobiaceae bacterium]|nr:hypothetical protein [Acidimicrobiaceae bacterium]